MVDCLKFSEDNVQPLQVNLILTEPPSSPPCISDRAATVKALQLVAAEELQDVTRYHIHPPGRVDMVMNDVSLLFCGTSLHM